MEKNISFTVKDLVDSIDIDNEEGLKINERGLEINDENKNDKNGNNNYEEGLEINDKNKNDENGNNINEENGKNKNENDIFFFPNMTERINDVSFINNNEISFIFNETDLINDTSFIYNNDDNNDNNDFLKLLGIMNNNNSLLDKKINNINSIFTPQNEVKSSKDISNSNNKRTKDSSSNLTGNDYKEKKKFSQSFQNSLINDKEFLDNKKIKYKNYQHKNIIIEENNGSKDLFNYNNNTFIGRTIPNILPLDENEECNENFSSSKKLDSFFGNSRIKFNINSQLSFIDNQNNATLFQYNKSKMNSSRFINSFINNKDKSYSSIISFSRNNYQNKTQNYFSFQSSKKDINSNNSIYSNKKRKRSPNFFDKNQNMTKDNISFSKINNQFINKFDFSLKENNNKKKNLFNTRKNNNYGRKKKDSGEIGKHKDSAPDNMRQKVKTLTFKLINQIINEELKKINIKDLENINPVKLFQINNEQTSNKTQKYNLELLNKSIRSIFSVPISGKSNNKKNHNEELINKIYEINRDRNLENQKKTNKIIKFLNMKLKDFFDYVSIIMDNKNLEDKIDCKDDDIEGIIKKFVLKLEEEFSKEKNNEDYNKKLKEKIKNFPSVISNMKVRKK